MDLKENIRAILDEDLPSIRDDILDEITDSIFSLTTRALEPMSVDDLNNMRVMGYAVADLIIVAERLRAGGVDLMQLKNYTDGFKDGYSRANTEFNIAMKQCVKNIIGKD